MPLRKRYQAILLPMTVLLRHLNQVDKAEFVSFLGGIFEHSPWVAEAAFVARPFSSVTELHQTMVSAVQNAGLSQQLDLIKAHPDLAGKAARAGQLSESSRKEQSTAGLDSLSESEFASFHELNQSYQQSFGFPFIIAVKGHDKHSILAAFRTRLGNDSETEIATALAQIAKIAQFRLEALIRE